MHQKDCQQWEKHTHTHKNTKSHRVVPAVSVWRRCHSSGQGEVKPWGCAASSLTVWSFSYVCLCGPHRLLCLCVCLFTKYAFSPVHQVCPLSRQIQADSRRGLQQRCASERHYHCSVCKTNLTIGNSGGRERRGGQENKQRFANNKNTKIKHWSSHQC